MAYYDGTDPYKAPLGPGDAPVAPDPAQPPPKNVGPNGGNATLAGVDGDTEVYQGSDGQFYVMGPTGADGFATWLPYSGTMFGHGAAPPPTTGGTAPPPTGGGGGYSAPPPGGATGGSTVGGGSTFTGVPPMVAPPYAPPPAYSAPKFAPPTADDVYNDPSFQFRFGMGQQALENSRGAQGTMGTGGTIKDFINYGQNFASQEYGKIYDRAFQTWAANNGTDKSVYDTNYQSQYTDPFAFAQHQADQANSLGFNYNVLGQQTSDSAFDRWYRTMLLKNQVAQ